jgi:gamma-glutamyltranspeptidase/glutathione hydrolase
MTESTPDSSAFAGPTSFTTRPTLRGSFGMSASTHWLATASAQSVLERGGNAFDAAVAAAFVLHVVEPHLNGPGGDLTGIIKVAGEPPKVLMGQGPAPRRATIEHYRSEGLNLVPGSGALAAAIPGSVPAWFLLLREHGSWELSDVLAYAIDYAENGHAILGRVVDTIASVKGLFEEHWPSSAAHWIPDGRMPQPGEIVTNRPYAAVLRRLIDAGTDVTDESMSGREARIDAAHAAWSSGFVAKAIEEFVASPHRHAGGTDHAGVIDATDLAGFTASFEAPVTLTFRGVTVTKTGPWGSGPVLLQTLAILENFDDARLDPSTAEGIHTIVEALKLALADRDSYYGDPGVDEPAVPLSVLLSPDYAAERAALIGERASAEFRPGTVQGYERFTVPLVEVGASVPDGDTGEPTQADSRTSPEGVVRGDTCHLDVVDRWGNILSITPSGGWLQSSPMIPDLGFPLGSRLQMSWLDEASPSALRPGRRPRTTLSPSMMTFPDGRIVAFGSPGGDQQDQWQLTFVLRTILGGFAAQEAIDAPAFHTTALPGSFWPRTWEPAGLVIEDRVGAAVIDELRRRGHRVTSANGWSLGRLSAVTLDPATGQVSAGANPRGQQGYAAGR